MAQERVSPLVSARLACGCEATFRAGVEGSPITVVVLQKADGCLVSLHVAGLPVYDHREAMRASTRHPQHIQPDFEEEG
jgi:hypothetical protein